MEKNVGTIDRAIRFIAGVVLFYFAFTTDTKIFVIVLTIFATIAIYESFIGFCGLYKLLGINTFRR